MTRDELYRRLAESPLILDGATGSNLQKAGMPPGVCPELWILEHPEALIELQKSFIQAGTELLYAPTFSGNRIKLAEYGVADQLAEINKELVGLSRRAIEEAELETDAYSASQAAVESGQETDVDSVHETGVDSIRETGVDSIRETGVDSVRDTDIDSIRETDVDSVRETDVDSVRETDVDSVQESGVDSVQEPDVKTVRPVLIAGDLTMTGVPLAPVGPMQIEELIDIYKEQAASLIEAGVDLFVVETMMSLAETRAAVIAVKEICDLPVIASMTYQADGRTLYGTDPVTALVVLQSLGADVVGINCSTGPAEMLPFLEKMKEYADVPLLVKPNAGLPILVDGKTVYPMEAEEFASYGPAFIEAGAAMLGGCCGTRPDHIRLLAERVKGMEVKPPCNRHPSVLASERHFQEITLDGPFLVIGERINPTGKKKLSAELREGSLDLVEEYAQTQEEMGAHILDINMGTNGIDEKQMMLAAIERVSMVTDLPLCIDTSYVEVMEAALRAYPGRALINSISMEEKKVNELLPLAKKYGAMFILLPLSDKGLPKSHEEKISYIHEITTRAQALGIGKENIIVDGLVTTVGANKKAALETLSTIRYCKEKLGLYTTIGLSNISFGLPERSYVNGAFAAMAISEGLTMAIANPSDHLLMGLSYASDLLIDKEEADVAYIEQIQLIKEHAAEKKVNSAEIKGQDSEKSSDGFGESGGSEKSGGPERSAGSGSPDAPGTLAGSGSPGTSESPGTSRSSGGPGSMDSRSILSDHSASKVFQAVLKGKKKGIINLVKAAVHDGIKPRTILDDILIPAINEVGRLFDEQRYFLPQLISSANVMKEAIGYLEPLLKEGEEGETKPVIVIATVEGDIHDIGKNLVALMLKNYGYQVYDLGKDVPAETIIASAREHGASGIVLSALMTTTMMKMKETIELRDACGLDAKVMIGGAVTTQSFADEIGADGWSKDAADAVRLAQRLL